MKFVHERSFQESVGGDEVQTSVKFVCLPSPHPGSLLKAPMPLPWGEGGRPDGGPGEGSAASGAPALGGGRVLATVTWKFPSHLSLSLWRRAAAAIPPALC